MSGAAALSDILRRIDRRSYRAYKDIAGAYQLDGATLFIDHVQGDPFAAPSKVRLRIPMARARLPEALWSSPARHLALRDYLAREVRRAIHRFAGGAHGSGKSGQIHIDAGGQEILDRTAVALTSDWVEARLSVGLPARGRSVLAREAELMLLDELPDLGRYGLTWAELDADDAEAFVDCADNQAAIREQLAPLDLVGFVADGSILPRASGASDRPLVKGAVPWRSPDALAVQVDLRHPLPDGRRQLRGTGVPRGVTLIVGGGYHGKSTLLRALERGVYPHVPGDGREYVVTDPRAVKTRAEDGRAARSVDISAFITDLPHGRSTAAFTSDDASGSTSQATNIMEAVEAGASSLLLDEDTSATNFMVRDARMQALVHQDDEPITPFVDRVRALYEQLGVSTVLVMGASGDYFDDADAVLMMRGFVAAEVTDEAKRIAAAHQTGRRSESRGPLSAPRPRVVDPRSLDPSKGRREVSIDARGLDTLRFGTDDIDVRQVEQLVDPSQARAIGYALALARRFMTEQRSLHEVLEELDRFLDREGLDPLDPRHRAERHPGNLARPRRFEIAAALNRLRALRVRPLSPPRAD